MIILDIYKPSKVTLTVNYKNAKPEKKQQNLLTIIPELSSGNFIFEISK